MSLSGCRRWRASPARTCDEAGVPLVYCSCLGLQEIDSTHLDVKKYSELSSLVQNLAEETVFYMNSLTQLQRNNEFSVCQKLELKEVRKAWGVHLSEFIEEINGFKTAEKPTIGTMWPADGFYLPTAGKICWLIAR